MFRFGYASCLHSVVILNVSIQPCKCPLYLLFLPALSLVMHRLQPWKYFVIASAGQFIMLQSLNSLELDQGNYKFRSITIKVHVSLMKLNNSCPLAGWNSSCGVELSSWTVQLCALLFLKLNHSPLVRRKGKNWSTLCPAVLKTEQLSAETVKRNNKPEAQIHRGTEYRRPPELVFIKTMWWIAVVSIKSTLSVDMYLYCSIHEKGRCLADKEKVDSF